MRSVLSAERGVRNAEYKAKSEAPQILDMRSGTPSPGLPPPLSFGGQAGGRGGVVSAKSEGPNPKSEGSPKGETTENARTKAALKTPQSKRWRVCGSRDGWNIFGARKEFRRPSRLRPAATRQDAALGFRLRCASARQAGWAAARALPPTASRALPSAPPVWGGRQKQVLILVVFRLTRQF